MPTLLIENIDANLHQRLHRWADTQGRTISDLAGEILRAADRARGRFNAIEDRTVRVIRRNRDGGCGLCDELEPLFQEIRRAG